MNRVVLYDDSPSRLDQTKLQSTPTRLDTYPSYPMNLQQACEQACQAIGTAVMI